MDNEYAGLGYSCFVVDERPFCVWDHDIRSRTLEFLEGIDPGYYDHVAKTFSQDSSQEDSLLASLMLRVTYSQSLETLFALIGAAIQAPYCAPAWMIKYRNRDLYSLVGKISQRKPAKSVLRAEKLSWRLVTGYVLSQLVLEDKDKEKAIKERFKNLWSGFASDFQKTSFSSEYNSIKHGLRLRPGGFHFTIGVEEQPGHPASQEQLRLVGKSEFGSSFFVTEKLNDMSHHIRLKQLHRNWDPEDFIWGLHLVSMSISNIIATLKIFNGVPADTVKYQWPRELDVFLEPWNRRVSVGVTDMEFAHAIPDETIEPFTKELILEKYQEGRYRGIVETE